MTTKSKTKKRPTKRRDRSAVTPASPLYVHLVSEVTGSLAKHVASVVLSQFPQLEIELHEHAFCKSAEKMRDVKRKIASSNKSGLTVVMSALTQTRRKKSFADWCAKQGIAHCHLVDAMIDLIADVTGSRPVRDVSRIHKCNDDYFRRIEAWEFTLQHDDSRRIESIGEADIILVGVSRVGKTPLAAYLGWLGHRVANVAIARGCTLPREVIDNREIAFGLLIDPTKLKEIRRRRFEQNKFANALHKSNRGKHKYLTERAAWNDVEFARQQFRRLRIPTIDMTDLTIEEAAAQIIERTMLDG